MGKKLVSKNRRDGNERFSLQRGLVVIIDGCNEEYINAKLTPFLWKLRQDGAYSKISSTPNFSNRVEIMSGNPPVTTDTFVDFCYDPKNSPFKFLPVLRRSTKLKERSPLQRKILRRATRLISRYGADPHNIPSPFLRFFALNSSIVRFLEKERRKEKDHIFGRLERSGYHVSYIYGSAQKITAESKALPSREKEIIFLHYGDTDKVGHVYGPKSFELKKVLREVSSSLERIYSKDGPFNFVLVFSDHTMREIKHSVDLWGALMKLDVTPIEDYMFFLNSPMARFWFKNNRARDEVVNFLSSLDYGKIITRQQMVDMKLPIDVKYGEIIFWLKDGFHISPDFYHVSVLKGMHGYADNTSKIPIILFHKNIKVVLRKEGALWDVAPTLLDLLNIESTDMSGRSLLENK